MKKLLAILLLTASPVYADQVTCPVTSELKCFTLSGNDCALPIIDMINKANDTLDLQFYNYTEPRLADAAVTAFKRGVKVRAVFDKVSPTQKDEQVEKLYDAGIPVFIDHIPAIAHDKTAVADGHLTSGGSFNSSTNADTKNAENVTITDSQCIAEASSKYISERIAVSRQFTGGGK